MKITIIGHGNVGSTLAKAWSKAGHIIYIGARNPSDPELEELANNFENIQVFDIQTASEKADVLLIAIPAFAVSGMAMDLKTLEEKIVIDATNSVKKSPEGYKTGAEAIKKITGWNNIAKGFNITGYENMENPAYGEHSLDMFTAGDSKKAKEIVSQLAEDLGFENTYDFGRDDKFELIEKFAMSWINLAILQGEGRNIGFKILRR